MPRWPACKALLQDFSSAAYVHRFPLRAACDPSLSTQLSGAAGVLLQDFPHIPYTVGLGCTSFYWISCTRSRYNYIQYYVLHICVSFHFPIYTHTVLNGMRSSGEILGIREPLHWLIHECWRTSKHWSELLLGSTWPSNVYCCYSMYDPKKFNFMNLWWILILILPVSK